MIFFVRGKKPSLRELTERVVKSFSVWRSIPTFATVDYLIVAVHSKVDSDFVDKNKMQGWFFRQETSDAVVFRENVVSKLIFSTISVWGYSDVALKINSK